MPNLVPFRQAFRLLWSRSHPQLWRALVLVLFFLASSAAAGADWLVMRDGSRLEIEGEPEVRGAMVVFKLPGGTLGSVRLSEVDLKASEEANAAQEAPPPPAAEPEEKKEAVLVLTNKDVAQAQPGSAVPAGGGAAAGGESADSAPAPAAGAAPAAQEAPRATVNEPFALLHWELRERGELGVEVAGTLSNQSAEPSAGLQATVRLVLEDTFQAERPAILQTNLLQPGAATTFRAPFPEFFLDAPEEEYQVEVRVTTNADLR